MSDVGDSGEGRIGLAELISTLRAELAKAQQSASETLPLQVQAIDLEVAFTFTKEAGAQGGVKFWVCEAGASGKLASERVQKVTLRLGPTEGTSINVARTVTERPD